MKVTMNKAAAYYFANSGAKMHCRAKSNQPQIMQAKSTSSLVFCFILKMEFVQAGMMPKMLQE